MMTIERKSCKDQAETIKPKEKKSHKTTKKVMEPAKMESEEDSSDDE